MTAAWFYYWFKVDKHKIEHTPYGLLPLPLTVIADLGILVWAFS